MKLTPEYAARSVNRLALMAYFPPEPEIRSALVEIIVELVETEEQCAWLVARALKLYPKWPGVAELRALYCSRFKPRDGVETYSTVFPDGIPSERPPAPPVSQLPPGRKVSADPELDRAVTDAGKLKRMPRAGRIDRP